MKFGPVPATLPGCKANPLLTLGYPHRGSREARAWRKAVEDDPSGRPMNIVPARLERLISIA